MRGLASLDLFDFGVLLQALSTNLKVGVLAVRSKGREKFLHMSRDKLLRIYTQTPKVSLVRVLYNLRAADRAVMQRAALEVRANGKLGPLWQYLIHTGTCTPEKVADARRYQMLEEILEVFYWKDVGFEFYPESGVDYLRKQGLDAVGTSWRMEEMLLRCTKTIDDIALFNSVTPSLRDVYELQFDSMETLEQRVPDPAMREFLLLIDGVRDMREVLKAMRMNRYDVLQLFYEFRKQGWIRPKNGFELLMLAENRRGGFSVAKRSRLLERVDQLGVEGFDVLVALAEAYEELNAPRKATATYVRHARRCLDADDSVHALSAVERAIAISPTDPELRRLEIDALSRAEKSAETGEAYRALADILRRQEKLDEAREALEQATLVHPAHGETWRELAEVFASSGRPRLGASRMRTAAEVFQNAGQTEIALDCYRRAVVLNPRGWAERALLVDCLEQCGRHDVAISELGRAVAYAMLELTDESNNTRVGYLERVEERLRELGGMASSTATELARGYVSCGAHDRADDLLRANAAALAAAGRHRSAILAYTELLDRHADDHDLRRDLARAHRARGDRDRALGQLRRVGTKLMAKKDYDPARQIFEEMLAVDPTCLDAHCGLAQTLLYLDEDERASIHYHRVGLLHRGCGRAEDAIPYLREAVDRRPEDADLLAEYCELLLNTTRRDETLEGLSRLVELHMAHGRPGRASIALTRILAIDAEYPRAREILQGAATQLLRLAEDQEAIVAEMALSVVERAAQSGAMATDSSVPLFMEPQSPLGDTGAEHDVPKEDGAGEVNSGTAPDGDAVPDAPDAPDAPAEEPSAVGDART